MHVSMNIISCSFNIVIFLQFQKLSEMELPEHLSITLSRDQKMKLLPFCATLVIYFILYVPLSGYPAETLGSVFFKVLPIWSLALYVCFTSNNLPLKIPTVAELIPEDRRARHFVFGLLVSSIGDACLVFRHTLFLAGVFFFAIAQILYTIGLDEDYKGSKFGQLFVLLGMNTYLCVQGGIDSYLMKFMVGIYLILVFTLGYRATARYETERTKAALLGSIGGLVFIFSDFMIAVDKWIFSVPCAGFIVMSTYYTAQFGLAMSTTKDLK